MKDKWKCEKCGSTKKSSYKLICSKCYSKESYKEKREYRIESANRWKQKNPKRYKEIHKKSFDKFYNKKRERFNELMRKNYLRNKEKHKSRVYTLRLILGNIHKRHPINFECKKCKAIRDLEIHHEIYPIKVEKIRKAIDEGKIYFLCKKCHRKV